MADVSVEWLKWPTTPYRVTPMTRLGRDHRGTWLFAPRGAAATYAASGAAPLPVNFLTLVPAGSQWWMATWMWGNADIEIDLYVDVVHPPVWVSESQLQVVDLDLDVVRLRDERVLVDDEDEFAEHAISLRYPPAVVTSARRTAKDAFTAISNDAPPFLPPPDQWTEAAARLMRPR